jgi:shikimate dehydrogenase
VINAGVLGSPISHSLSPLLHKTAYDFLGIEAKYSAYEVPAGGLADFLAKQGKDLNCLSLTMPLKEEALKIADHISPIAQQIASGNTLYKKDNSWHLTSTDVEGFIFALSALGKFEPRTVLIIGAGATARAVAAACNHSSISITVVGRSESRRQSILHAAPNVKIDFVEWNSQLDLDSYDLVVNTTPGDSASVFLEKVKAPQGTFFEVIYNPWPTLLLDKWRNVGGTFVDGLDLLVHQAISQIEIFSGQRVVRVTMAQLLRDQGLRALQ